MGIGRDFLGGNWKQVTSVTKSLRWIDGKFCILHRLQQKYHNKWVWIRETSYEMSTSTFHQKNGTNNANVSRLQNFTASQVIVIDLTMHTPHCRKAAGLSSLLQKTMPKQQVSIIFQSGDSKTSKVYCNKNNARGLCKILGKVHWFLS